MTRWPEFGEDKVLRLVFDGLGIKTGFFVDIGSGGPYSNTSWLKVGGLWSGLEFDRTGDQGGIAIHVTAENVRTLLSKHSNIDFISIDIDGNDIFVLKAILDNGYRPAVVICEFNMHKKAADDIQPYDPDFVWPGGGYFGCSWKALNELCEPFGYILAFKNLVNAIFVKTDDNTVRTLFPKTENP